MNPQVNLYKKNQVYTTSNENLVLMLYDGVRRVLNRAVKSMQEGDIQEANHNLLQAQNIVSELMAGINFEAGEIAKQLYALYEYMHYRLVQANMKKNLKDCQEVLNMIEELREVWLQMLKSKCGQADNFSQNNMKIS